MKRINKFMKRFYQKSLDKNEIDTKNQKLAREVPETPDWLK